MEKKGASMSWLKYRIVSFFGSDKPTQVYDVLNILLFVLYIAMEEINIHAVFYFSLRDKRMGTGEPQIGPI